MKSLTKILILITGTYLLGACSSMNSKFSCNLTAGDLCMSMDEVNALTEGKTIHIIRKTQIAPAPVIKTQVKRIWIAPYTDNSGKQHKGMWVNVPEPINQKIEHA